MVLFLRLNATEQDVNMTPQRSERQALRLALAGSVVLIIGMGYGRFAYTGILPVMLDEQILSLRQGNLAASVNYAGYLIGALLLSKARLADSTRLTLASVVSTLVCLALLAWVKSPLAIILIRGLAGVLSAVTLIAGSLWLLQHMKHHHGAPVLFSGVGMGIFIRRMYLAGKIRLALQSTNLAYLRRERNDPLFTGRAPAVDAG
jgi:MFS family permease